MLTDTEISTFINYINNFKDKLSTKKGELEKDEIYMEVHRMYDMLSMNLEQSIMGINYLEQAQNKAKSEKAKANSSKPIDNFDEFHNK